MVDHPRIGNKDVVLSNHRGSSNRDRHPLDQLSMTLFIDDEGRGYASLDEMVRKLRQNAVGVTPVKEVRFKNGVMAKTWTELVPMVEIAREVRTFVFLGPNGHFYRAEYDLTVHKRIRWRYDYLFRRILDTMEFKPDAAP